MKTEQNDILKKLEPFKKNDSFKVPEGYFDSLSSRVQQKIQAESHPKKSILVTFKPWIAVAAVLIIGLILIKVGFEHTPNQPLVKINDTNEQFADPVLTELSDTELMEYIAMDESIVIEQKERDLTMGLNPEELESLVLF
jgi:hypothetical protein